ncbi:PAS domain S-box-containing protein [Alkalibacillus flavidus]|uniref:PAS domain S-box-containing protein n=1 Tax=Alkalibacillus flavidus TaxID=546021 RepID=A0ABV2KVZ2_9BACI
MKDKIAEWKEHLQSPKIVYPDINQEIDRLRSIHQLNLELDCQEDPFDNITELAKSMFGLEMALITIVDSDWQWFKSCIGLPDQLEKDGGTTRDKSFCQYLFIENKRFQVEDALEDSRFKNNPLVTEGLIRFYAGTPLRLSDGHIIGSLCVLDSQPNHLTEDQFDQLEKLANWAMTEIEVKQKVQDLTDQQKSINELLERNAYLTAGIEHSSSSIVITDAKQPNNPIIYVNQAFTELTGYEPDEVIGYNCKMLQGDDTDQGTINYIRSCIQNLTPIHTEILNYRKNGEPFWNELIINPITDDSGDIPYFIGIQQDITKRKHIEQGLVKELFEKDRLFNALPELIIMLDNKGQIHNANSRLLPFSGYTLTELMNKPITELIQTEELSPIIDATFNQGNLSFEGTLISKENEYLPFQWNFLALRGADGTPSSIVAIGEDIRDRLQLQKDVEYAGRLQKESLQPNIQNDQFTLQFLHEASNYVSGDSYGYDFDHNQNRLFIYLIDMMGHGVATALQTSTINLLFNQISRENLTVKEKVEWVNKACVPIFPSAYFATAFCADIDLNTGDMTYVAAGINFFAYEKDGETIGEKVPGPLIGLQEEMEFTEHQMTLNPGDALYLMTDGIYEQIDTNEVPHGFDKYFKFVEYVSENQIHSDDATAIGFKWHQ